MEIINSLICRNTGRILTRDVLVRGKGCLGISCLIPCPPLHVYTIKWLRNACPEHVSSSQKRVVETQLNQSPHELLATALCLSPRFLNTRKCLKGPQQTCTSTDFLRLYHPDGFTTFRIYVPLCAECVTTRFIDFKFYPYNPYGFWRPRRSKIIRFPFIMGNLSCQIEKRVTAKNRPQSQWLG